MKLRKPYMVTALAAALSIMLQSASAEVKIASQSDMLSSPIPHSSSMLEVESVTKGVLIPRMTTVQRDAITAPAEGLLIYNSDRRCVNSYHSAGNPEWHDYCLSGQVVVDARITGSELTETNSSAIKVVEYNDTEINFENSFDTSSHIFTAPIAGLYTVRATYGQQKCSSEYYVRIGISQPNVTPPGNNASLSAVRWPAKSNTACSIPLVAEVADTFPLQEGDEIFIQARYQQAIYDVSAWNYKNEYQNRLLIIYAGPLE